MAPTIHQVLVITSSSWFVAVYVTGMFTPKEQTHNSHNHITFRFARLKSPGIIFKSKLTFDRHVSSVCKARNYHMWVLRHICRVLPLHVAKTLASSIVSSRLERVDYCNSVLYDTPNSTIFKPMCTECKTVLNMSHCNSGSLVNLCWHHCTGFQFPSRLISNWQLWHTR